jgi:hypothetical protein
MKKITISLYLILGIINFCFAQTQSNLSTPKGSPVTAYIVPEMSDADRSYWDTYWSSTSRTEIITSNNYSSSQTFNCHGYAWSIAEGGPTRWIGYYYTTDEDIYMTDGSYVQVCSETYPAKVSWGSGDHSAVTTATPGIWISKWNKYPLMQHAWNDTPYGTTNLKYYVSTKISGDNSPFCSSTRAFSVQNITGATYSWTVNSALVKVSGDGTNQLIVQRNGSANAVGSIQVQITTPCSGVAATSAIFSLPVGSPSPGSLLQSISPLCVNTEKYASIAPVIGATGYNWVSNSSNLDLGTPCGTTSCATGLNNLVGGYAIGTFSFNITATNFCGTSPAHIYNVGVVSCGSSITNNLSIYPNPTSSTLNIEYLPEDNHTQIDSNLSLTSQSPTEFSVSLSDSFGQKKKSGTSTNSKITIDVRDIPKGLHFLQINLGEKIITRQILIDR